MRVFVLGYFIQLILLYIHFRKFEKIDFSPNWGIAKSIGFKVILKYSFIMMLATLSSIAMKNIDILILGHYVSLDNIAVYSIAVTIAGIIEAPATALGRIADSKISHSFSSSDLSQIQIIYFKSTRLLTILGFLLFIGVWINIRSLLFFLPLEYSTGEQVVIIVSLSALFNMITGINSSIIL
jgi:O-antigen/teichoic acid export membrane protein